MGHTHQTMSKIKNLKEFLAWRGFGEDEVGYWSRCFYKYTDCGPWVVFLMRDEDARDETSSFIVRRGDKGKLECVPGGPLNEQGVLPPDDLLSRFGFNQKGQLKKDYRSDSCMRSMQAYWEALKEYREKLDSSDKFEINAVLRPRTWNRSGYRRWIFVDLKRHVPAAVEEIYYEDVLRGDKVVDPDRCVGIKFGSIVEGSDACSGPYEHFFPFKKKDFDRDIEHMDAETSFYWERDNSQWYEVRVTGGTGYYVHNTWGDIRWDGVPPYKQLRERIERFIEEHWEDIPHIPGYWAKAQPDWQPLKIPGTRATIHEYCNDGIF